MDEKIVKRIGECGNDTYTGDCFSNKNVPDGDKKESDEYTRIVRKKKKIRKKIRKLKKRKEMQGVLYDKERKKLKKLKKQYKQYKFACQMRKQRYIWEINQLNKSNFLMKAMLFGTLQDNQRNSIIYDVCKKTYEHDLLLSNSNKIIDIGEDDYYVEDI